MSLTDFVQMVEHRRAALRSNGPIARRTHEVQWADKDEPQLTACDGAGVLESKRGAPQ